MSDALAGLKVLDVSTLFAGPLAATMLGDFGADIIKVEHPRGDPVRSHGASKDGVGLWAKVVNRNKRGITLYLGSPEGQDVFRRLVADADVVIENFRPGTLERWGLGYPELSADNPGLVLARVTGFGQIGPYAGRPGFGTLAEAMSGFAAITGEPDGPPTLPPFGLADGIAALAAAFATMTALRARETTGRGQVIDLAIIEPILTLLGPQPTVWDALQQIQERSGNRSANNAPRNTYLTKDGRWVAVSTSAQSIAERVMRLVGRPELTEEPWFASGGERAKHADVLDEAVASWVARHDRDEVVLRLRGGAGGGRPDLRRPRRRGRPAVPGAGLARPGPRPRARLGAHAERPLPALRDAGADHQRRPRPRAAHGGGAGRDRDRRRPGGRAAAPGGGVSVPRSWLYVPGHRPDRVRKALASAADAVVVDLEDAVPAAAKDEARRSTVALLRDRPADWPPVWVRVNPPTEAVGRADVDALAGMPVDGLRLPRCEDPAVVHAVAEQTGHDLYLLLETARGLLAARGAGRRAYRRSGVLASASRTSPPTSWSRPTRGWTGPGATSSPRPAPPGSGRRSRACGRASGTSTACAPPATTGLAMGFFGRSVVHPSQIPVVHEVFTPSPEEVAEARAVLATGAEARAQGEVAALDAQGRFVDPAVEARARVVLDRIPVDRDVDLDPKGQS